jgi:hypothetical protein
MPTCRFVLFCEETYMDYLEIQTKDNEYTNQAIKRYETLAKRNIVHIEEVLPESNNEFVNFLANSYNYKLY